MRIKAVFHLSFFHLSRDALHLCWKLNSAQFQSGSVRPGSSFGSKIQHTSDLLSNRPVNVGGHGKALDQ